MIHDKNDPMIHIKCNRSYQFINLSNRNKDPKNKIKQTKQKTN